MEIRCKYCFSWHFCWAWSIAFADLAPLIGIIYEWLLSINITKSFLPFLKILKKFLVFFIFLFFLNFFLTFFFLSFFCFYIKFANVTKFVVKLFVFRLFPFFSAFWRETKLQEKRTSKVVSLLPSKTLKNGRKQRKKTVKIATIFPPNVFVVCLLKIRAFCLLYLCRRVFFFAFSHCQQIRNFGIFDGMFFFSNA